MSLTVKQLATRREGVGASEVAAALGLSPYLTPLALYQVKRGEVAPVEESLPMRYGNHIEPFVLGEFSRKHPEFALVPSPDTMRRGPMLAHLDAWVPSECNVQVKTARTRQGWGDSGSPDIPMHYVLQVQAEMLLANVRVSFVPVLFGGADYDEFVVEADAELQDMVETGVHDFWRRVQSGEPPDPVTVEDAIARWGRSSITDRVMADDTVLAAIQALHTIREQRAAVDQIEESAKAIVLRALGERDTLVGPDGKTLATWKSQAGAKRFDATLFRSEHPDLAAAFTIVGEPCRRFLLKPTA
jgi:putative phage-type endonuclease